MSDGAEERSPEEMVVEREESGQIEQREEMEREAGERQRDDDSGRMEEDEGETVEGHEPKESEDAEFLGARRAGQSGAPPFSDEDEMEMLEFVQAHTVHKMRLVSALVEPLYAYPKTGMGKNGSCKCACAVELHERIV